MTHEALGHMDVALACYQEAAKLEPQNEIFQASYQCALDSTGGNREANLAAVPGRASGYVQQGKGQPTASRAGGLIGGDAMAPGAFVEPVSAHVQVNRAPLNR
jgi:hypothetical protein